MFYSLAGEWQAEIGDGKVYSINLPGTLDEAGIGGKDAGGNAWHPDITLGNEGEDFSGKGTILTRFTRKYTYEGEARLTRRVSFALPRGKRLFLEAERARCLKLLVDGQEIPNFGNSTISTPHVFELTQVWKGEHAITLCADNSYPGLPHDDIIASSAATDETQTNWNGVLGYLRLRVEEPVFLEAVRVYPQENRLTVKIDLCADRPWSGRISVDSAALKKSKAADVRVQKGSAEIVMAGLTLREDVARWDEYEGNLYELTVSLLEDNAESLNEKENNIESLTGKEDNTKSISGKENGVENLIKRDTNTKNLTERKNNAKDLIEGENNAESLSEKKNGIADFTEINSKTVSFGIRDFAADQNGRLALNGRTIFLRSEANCAEFPETGYGPMSEEEWLDILETYKSYGVNCVRFHSHCPPEAAFYAADRMGMLMQPELSHWNPKDAFESEESFAYYRTELLEIIRTLANHPSFVMLTFGNELHASARGHERMRELLAAAHVLDQTRLYANGSNVHYGNIGCDENSDFYTSSNYFEWHLRGTFANMAGYINHAYPSAMTNYDKTMDVLREKYKKPVFSFEVGQFEVLPDFEELAQFNGISRPDNYQRILERAKERGLMPVWKQYVEATGELAKIGYREEIEAALRTRQLSGISLLGLQDFPGQGTALVGMLNSHLKPKPYHFAKPESFRAFFAAQLPLVLLPKYTYESTEILEAKVQVANYGKEELTGEICVRLGGPDFLAETKWGNPGCPAGELTDVGTIRLPLAAIEKPVRLDLTVSVGKCFESGVSGSNVLGSCISDSVISGSSASGSNVSDSDLSDYMVSNTYPIWVYPPVKPVCPADIYETMHLDEGARAALEAGKTVYLTPPSTREALPHSIQAQFTTDFWSVGTFSGQEGGMGQLIDKDHPLFKDFPTEFHTNWQWWAMASQRAVILPKPYQAIITEMDSYAYLRPMAQLLECRCGNGKLLFSSMGLQDLQAYPEARALLASIYRYLDSEEFVPEQEMEWKILETLVH